MITRRELNEILQRILIVTIVASGFALISSLVNYLGQ